MIGLARWIPAFSLGCVALALQTTLAFAAQAADAPAKPLNVLFIAVDDLRTQLGCYGQKQMKSPNIDRLASHGTVFTRAYCQQAVCSPSRTSLLTGCRPDATKVWDLETHFRDFIPDVVTLPQLFIQHGYYAHAIGKLYHGGFDDPKSWSVPHEASVPPPAGMPKAEGGAFTEKGIAVIREQQAEQQAAREKYMKEKGISKLSPAEAKKFRVRGLPWDAPDVPDEALADGCFATRAIEVLRERAAKPGEPFFLAVGFLKPHLPFIAPKKYWDMYKPEDLVLADNPFAPKGAPPYALSNYGELRAYYGMPKQGPLSKEQEIEAVHGYYAAVSFMDAQVGRILDELDSLGMRENTIVVLWGDHGWKLGDHGEWCKHTNFEIDTNAPLIISVPGQQTAGSHSAALVEFVDIYPTLAELCDLPLPSHLEGSSFVPQILDPNAPGKEAAFSQYPRGSQGQSLMGYTLRSDRYRYVEWRVRNSSEVVSVELYDHETDPKENVNVVGEKEYAQALEEMKELMKGGWQAQQARVAR